MLIPTRFGKGGIKLENYIRDRIAPPYKDNAYSTFFANTSYIANTAYSVAYMLHICIHTGCPEKVPDKINEEQGPCCRGTFKLFQMGSGCGYMLKTIRAPEGLRAHLICAANICCLKLQYVTRLLSPWMRCVNPESHCLRNTRSNVWNLANLNSKT